MDSNKGETRKPAQEEAAGELRELVKRAKKGDRSAVPRLREYLIENPQLWEQAGDLAVQSQAAWIRLVSGDNKHLQETVVMKANALKTELACDNSSTLENLLIERIISTWLQLYYQESRAAQGEEKSLKWAEFRLKQATAAADAHTKAIAALATFKKLLPAQPKEPDTPHIEAVAATASNSASLVGPEAEEPSRHINGSVNRVGVYLNGHATVSSE